jgi:hypothetical protein
MSRSLGRSRAVSLLLPVAVAAAVLSGCGGGTSTAAPVTPSAPAPAASSAPVVTPSTTPAPSATPGLAGSSPDQILAAARTAMKGAESTHLQGAFDDADGSFELDVRMSKQGDSVAAIQISGLGTLEVRSIGTTAYISGDDAFWGKLGLSAATLRNKWIKTSTSNKDFADFLELTSMSRWADQFLEPDGSLKVVAGKDFAGVATVGLDDGDGADSGIVYVATQGDAFPLALESDDGKNTLTFTEWNEPFTVTAPPAGSVITP